MVDYVFTKKVKIMFNYLLYFQMNGDPVAAVVKENNPDDALHKLSETLYNNGANSFRLITMQSVTEEYLFENKGLIHLWV